MPRALAPVLGLIAALLLTSSALASVGTSIRIHESRNLSAASFCADPEESAFLSLMNTYRVQNGLKPLVFSQTIGAAADYHSVDMALNGILSHTLSDGTDWAQNMTNFGYTYNTWRGEIAAGGYLTASQTFEQLRLSPTHNAIMLSTSYTAVGIGTANTGNEQSARWTVDFGGYADAAVRMCDATSMPTPLPTATQTPGSATATSTVIATNTRIATSTATATRAPTTPPTATRTATTVPSATNTIAPSATATRTPTATSPQPTATATQTTVPVVYVAGMNGRSTSRKGASQLAVTVTVKNASGQNVASALVTMTVMAPDGSAQTISATTNNRGQASWSGSATKGRGLYTVLVANVSATGKTYDRSRDTTDQIQITVK